MTEHWNDFQLYLATAVPLNHHNVVLSNCGDNRVYMMYMENQ